MHTIKSLGATAGKLSLAKVAAERWMQAAQDLRPWWPLLIPYLVWQARKTYKRSYSETLLEQAQD